MTYFKNMWHKMPQILHTRGHCYSPTAKHTRQPWVSSLTTMEYMCWIHITCTLNQAQINPCLQLIWTTLLHPSPAGFSHHCLGITSPWKDHQVLKGTNSHHPGNGDHWADDSGYQRWQFLQKLSQLWTCHHQPPAGFIKRKIKPSS